MTDKRQDFSDPREFVRIAPMTPGVYLMKDYEGRIIYIGKAKVLKNRLSSYFVSRKSIKTEALMAKVRTIETISTDTEYEALLLENTLIKQHSPHYNINLKDGKTYPVIRITNEAYPRVFRTRRIVDDGSKYFGPFPDAQRIDIALEVIAKLFPLRKCVKLRKRKTPCMYFHIGRCMAPCADRVTEQEYREQVKKIELLLSGETNSLINDLTMEMHQAAIDLKFEKASQLRDAIAGIERFKDDQHVVDFDPEDRDYVSWYSEGGISTFVVFQMRIGRMAGRELYRSRYFGDTADAVENFIVAYYGVERLPPPSVYLNLFDEGFESTRSLIERYFKEELDSGSVLKTSGEQRHAAVLAMAMQNAKEDVILRVKAKGDPESVADLGTALKLSRPPTRIEGFDIAHLSGKLTVASLISFVNGVPDKRNYRYFRIRSLRGKIDDFEAIREATARRYSRLLNENAEMPDLIMIDGGIGQVNAAKSILDGLGLSIPLVGLAKKDEELWLPLAHDPLKLPRNSAALRLLQRVRDETHRFATGLNQRLRTKEIEEDGLTSIPGIGQARRKKILDMYGSMEKAGQADIQEVAELLAMPYTKAEKLVSAIKALVVDDGSTSDRNESTNEQG